jgi:Xaa-Pro aminopeptidase
MSNEAKKRCRFNSNDIYPIETDSTMPFEQSRDILKRRGSGESILLLFPDAPYEHKKEILFLKETNDHSRWEGEKLTKNALAVTGIKTVYWLQDFERYYSK